MRGHRTRFFRAVVASGAVAVLFAGANAAAATTAARSGPVWSRQTASAVSGQAAGAGNGRWIAYSTAPATDVGYGTWGSDVFVTTAGGPPETELVADRGDDKLWNVCPAFSPNGRMLAFARVRDPDPYNWNPGAPRSRIVIVRLGAHGPVTTKRLVLKVRAGRARCPVWSSDSSRLAYLDHGRVVVRDLHGARRHRSKGDPTIHDFDRSPEKLVSPTGELVARQGPDGTIVSRADGSDQRVIPDEYAYTIAGWSPDGRKLLLVDDFRGVSFRIRALSVDPPFASETVADDLPDHTTRPQLPGYGDMSWQPIPEASALAAVSTPAMLASTTRCARIALKGAFPMARPAGFTERGEIRRIRRSSLTAPVGPGLCARWSTSYRRGEPAVRVHVDLTRYNSHSQAMVMLADEPVYRPVKHLPNGGLLRSDKSAWSVAIVSVYRDVLISTVSEGEMDVSLVGPASVASQVCLQRQIRAGIRTVETRAPIRSPSCDLPPSLLPG